jgi:hypothetical protein
VRGDAVVGYRFEGSAGVVVFFVAHTLRVRWFPADDRVIGACVLAVRVEAGSLGTMLRLYTWAPNGWSTIFAIDDRASNNFDLSWLLDVAEHHGISGFLAGDVPEIARLV